MFEFKCMNFYKTMELLLLMQRHLHMDKQPLQANSFIFEDQ